MAHDHLPPGETSPAALELNLVAAFGGLVESQQVIENYCRQAGIEQEETARILIVVEELFTNSIKHGYRGECQHPIRLRLSARPTVELVYEDEAGPFDPTKWACGQELGKDPEQRSVGRTGIALVMGLARSAVYERAGAINRLTLAFGEE
jgi:anti-sigma regulatory factor (Ser/Thr protein kinase)